MKEENHILTSWHQNAAAWAKAIENHEIASRRLITNEAILQAIRLQKPKTLWDAGCGEGWLSRAMEQEGVQCFGTDAIEALVLSARSLGKGRFEVLSYQQIAAGQIPAEKFDAVVFNFSLFGDDLAAATLRQVKLALHANGKLIIQTLHPHTANAGAPYVDGWRDSSWDGFSAEFVNPAPWYFRTLQGWVNLLGTCGYTLEHLEEPLHPETLLPASLILTAIPKVE